MSIIFCKTPEEVLQIKGTQKIRFFCKSCGKEAIRTVKSSSKQRLSRLLCTKCSYIETCMSRYGHRAFTQSIEFKSKAQITMLAKYGGKCTAQSAVLQEKCKQTNLKKYGAEFPFGSSIVKNKSKQTFQAKYGKNSYVETDSFKTIIDLNYHGFNAGIDNLSIQNEYFNKNTIIQKQPKRFGIDFVIGPQVGYGYGFKGASPYVGIGATIGFSYRLTK